MWQRALQIVRKQCGCQRDSQYGEETITLSQVFMLLLSGAHWLLLQGREKNYLGEAINPVNLSLYERLTGQGRNYDAGLDAKMVREEINAAQERRRVKAGDAPGAIELQTNSPPATVV